MDQFISLMYYGLPGAQCVGGVFQSPEDEHEWYVPLLCQGERFIMIFGLMTADPVFDRYAEIIRSDANHRVGTHAYSLKYAAATMYFSNNRFAPLEAKSTTRNLLRQTVPELMLDAVKTFLAYRPQADEFYFIAGAEEEERIDKLNLWYHRVGGRLAASIGFTPIHLSKGDWHGYRKAHDQGAAEDESSPP